MKLILTTDLRSDIIDLIEAGKAKTWDTTKVSYLWSTIKVLIHTGSSPQYEGVGLRMKWSISHETLTISPLKIDKELSDDEYFDKCCVVLGRFAEFLNRYFPNCDYTKIK